ncbi:MAG: PepSY-associated TM helix domain-containing protein, partial [Bacteroidota bacterium]
PGDANSYVYVRRSYQDHVHYDRDVFFFDAATGEVLHHFVTEPVMTAQHFLIGFHIIQFDHWALRWLYFLAGLTGCILIGTGFIYWMEKRRKKHEELGMKSIKIVEMLTIGSVTGIIAATALFFVVNRILPLGFELGGIERSAVEVIAFYLFWIGTFAHAWVRRRRAWSDQLWATAVLSVAAVVLNALTTGGHMIQTAIDGQWNVFGMDALLLATAALCVVIARRLDRKAKAELVPPEKTTVPEKAPPVRAAVRPASRIAARPGGRSRTAVAGPPEGDGAATRTPAPIAPPPTAQQSDDT